MARRNGGSKSQKNDTSRGQGKIVKEKVAIIADLCKKVTRQSYL